MHIGLYGLHKGSSADPARRAARAQRAEAVGVESLWVGDHIALPLDAPDDADQPRLELIVALVHLATVTERVRLGTGVAILPMRHPVLLAKQLTSLDVVSQGRLVVGIGAGYLEGELRALGTSPAERGARTDEHLAAMLALWDAEAPAFAGAFTSFDGVRQRPLPVQRPHPPIVVGGHVRSAYRRAVQHGQGWYGWGLDLDGVRAVRADLADAAAEHSRPPELGDLEITLTPPGPVDRGLAEQYAAAGVDRLVLEARDADGDEVDDLIEVIGAELVGQV